MADAAELRTILKHLQGAPGLVNDLPEQEARIVRAILDHQDIHLIAQQHRISEAAVWATLRAAARMTSGQAIQPIETGGLGSDTDPGRSGGYGDTGFGAVGNEPPIVTPEEPHNQQGRNEHP